MEKRLNLDLDFKINLTYLGVKMNLGLFGFFRIKDVFTVRW